MVARGVVLARVVLMTSVTTLCVHRDAFICAGYANEETVWKKA